MDKNVFRLPVNDYFAVYLMVCFMYLTIKGPSLVKVSTQMTHIDVAYAIHIHTIIIRFFQMYASSKKGKGYVVARRSAGMMYRKGPTTVFYFQFPSEYIHTGIY